MDNALFPPLPARGYLIDLDGTLVAGGQVLPDAAALLAAVDNRFVLVSNDAEHTPLQVATMLRRLGLAVPAQRIVLAGTTAIEIIAAEAPGARLLLLGSNALKAYARTRGLRPVARDPDIVLLARDRRFSYASLAVAANALRAGAPLVVTNPDRVHPAGDGLIVPETGALLQALLACTGGMPYRIVGKPEPGLFQAGLALLGTDPGETVMIGDNPATDGAGAARLGLGFVPIVEGRLAALAVGSRRDAPPPAERSPVLDIHRGAAHP